MRKWSIAVFAVIGAFFSFGIFGAGVASLLGVWETPVAGFFAAFGVVVVTYISVPSRSRISAATVFLVGCAVAWTVLEPSSYPELYERKAYQPTHLPLVITLLGGVTAFGVCVLPIRRQESA